MSTKNVEMSPAQCRAGRALLDMTQSRLGELAQLGLSTVVDFEKGRRQVSPAAVEKISKRIAARGCRIHRRKRWRPRSAPAQTDAKAHQIDRSNIWRQPWPRSIPPGEIHRERAAIIASDSASARRVVLELAGHSWPFISSNKSPTSIVRLNNRETENCAVK